MSEILIGDYYTCREDPENLSASSPEEALEEYFDLHCSGVGSPILPDIQRLCPVQLTAYLPEHGAEPDEDGITPCFLVGSVLLDAATVERMLREHCPEWFVAEDLANLSTPGAKEGQGE